MTSEHRPTAFVDVEFHDHPGVIGTGVVWSDRGVWLIDPGPSSSLDGLARGLKGLGLSYSDVRGLLLTHIHLDHAGGSGTLVRQCPEMRVMVHERGARHMIDPSRLIESAGRLYVGTLERLWGEIAPVPESNVDVLKGGESLVLDGRAFEVAYTPGHASHHVSYFLPDEGVAFVGDTAGARLGTTAVVVPPTPPPDIDLTAWTASLDRIRAWNAVRLYLTHFGAICQPADHLAELERRLTAFADAVKTTLDEPGDDRSRMGHFIQWAVAQLRQVMSEEDARNYQLAVPLDHCWMGLARYWRKRQVS